MIPRAHPQPWRPRGRAPSWLLCLLLGLGLALPDPATAAPPEILYLTLTSDQHGRIGTEDGGGAPRLATFLHQLRARALHEGARLLNLHGGDLYQGTPAVNASQGRCMLPIVSALRFHLGVPGNHEWDYGAEGFQRLASLTRPLTLSSNIDGLRERHYRSLSYQLGRHRIGFLGYTIPDTENRAPPGATQGLHFRSGEVLEEQARSLRSRGVDCLVLVTHTDREEAEELGRRLGAELVLGAHTNEVEPPRQLGEGGPWYFQAGFHLLYGGWIRLAWSPDGSLAPPQGAVESLAGYPPDPEIEALAEPFVAPFRDRLSRLVTTLDHTLYMGPWGGHSTLVTVASQGIRDLAGTRFAILNVKATREKTLGPGKIFGRTLYEAFPYENRIAVVHLTGQELDELFEQNNLTPFRPPRETERWRGQMSTDSRGVLQPAGLRVELDPNRAPGDRIQLFDELGTPLDPDQSYEVATSDFLAGGGDGHEVFRRATARILDATVLEALTERFASYGNLAPCGPGGLRNLTHDPVELSCPE